jgi:hypothetical protein
MGRSRGESDPAAPNSSSRGLLNIVEGSITAEVLVAELKKVFAAAGGPPTVLRVWSPQLPWEADLYPSTWHRPNIAEHSHV